MALYDGFFDGVEDGVHEDGTTKYDREYESTDFTNYFGQIVGSGVCIHDNPDSFKAEFEDGTLYLRPGYLFIHGYWLANVPGEDDDPASYKGYAVTLPETQTGPVAVVAHLNLGQKIIEIETRSVSQAYPDSLVLAIVDASAAEDTRHNTDICGVIDSAGSLSGKIEYAINYINNEIDGKLKQIESDIAEHELKLDAKIAEAQAVADKIAPPPVGTIKFSASQDVGGEWLKCDGSVVNRENYPELVDLLLDLPDENTGEESFGAYWESATLPSDAHWNSVAYGNGKFVAISGGNKAAYSTDGIAWAFATLPYSLRWCGIAYGNGKFVAIAAETYGAAYSTDGIAWAFAALPDSLHWRGIAYGNGKFVAIAAETNKAAYSTDGINWTETTFPYSSWCSIAFGNGKFVAIQTPKGGTIAYSTDGINWTETTFSCLNWRSIAFGNGKFVVVVYDSQKTFYSEDGVAWAESTMPSSEYWNSVVYGENKFVAVCGDSNKAGNKAAYSIDGINWAEAPLPFLEKWISVTCGSGRFVAVSQDSNKAAYSSHFENAYLPNLSLSNVPAYIKAKEPDSKEAAT